MKFVYTGAALMMAAAAYAGTFSAQPELDYTLTGSIQTGVSATHESSERFILQVDGLDSGCTVVTTENGTDEKPLSLSPVCSIRVPALAGAKNWLDREDGTIAFTEIDGRVVAEFAVADGAALESYSPHQPIMTLLAN